MRRELARSGGPAMLLATAGPAIIAGASDADPTTVGTLAVVGSTTTYSLSWLVLLLIPILGLVQAIASRVGMASGRDLQHDVVCRYGRIAQVVLLAAVVPVNLFTIAADVAAGGSALELLTGVDWRLMTPVLAVAVLALLLAGGFDEVQSVLKYVVLVLLAFGAAAVLAEPDWGEVLHHTLVPELSLQPRHLTATLALLGTTLTGYVYMWQSIERAEEQPDMSQTRVKSFQSVLGIVVAVAVFWFILVATAATLGVKGHEVQSSREAAQALEPVAGPAATYLFAVGMLASTLIALPILAAVTAYVMGAEFNWRRGLSQPVRRARGFYAVIAASLLLGVICVVTGLRPITLLFLASLAGGLSTPVSLGFLMVVARDARLMGRWRITRRMAVFGWLIVATVTAVSVFFLVQTFTG
ncbi:NRAMP family divalent metal transporter [Nonomuraea pusilla]|nr:divalent metal cation transporter [Nonomuraea pusilla]